MKKILFFTFLLWAFNIFPQVDLTYQKPPEEILELAEAPLPPSIRIDSQGEKIIFLYRDNYKSIETLSQEELRLGGLRINPKTNINSRENYYNDIKVKTSRKGTEEHVTGLPDNPRISNVSWSPNEEYVAFTNTSTNGVALWVLNVKNKSAKKLTDYNLNANTGNPYDWFKNSQTLLIKVLEENRDELIDKKTAVPTGPTVSVSEAGVEAQNRTYQDLLKNKADEHNFEQLVRSEIFTVDLNGIINPWKEAGMYRGISFSPDGDYLMITTIEKPFSYLVPYYRFPFKTNIYKKDGTLVKTMLEVPLIEDLPKGRMAEREGMRDLSWRDDKPHTIVWAEALDGGDPEKEVPYRDQIFQIEAPFDGNPKPLIKTINRFSSIQWGNNETAIAYDYWWDTRNVKTYLFNPNNPDEESQIIVDRNYQDVYSDPGSIVTKRNEYDRRVIDMVNGNIFMIGDGYSPEGKFPFVDQVDLKTLNKTRLYQSSLKNKLEDISTALDMKKGEILVRIESQNEYPNYYIRNIKKKTAPIPLTQFENPFKSIQNSQKRVIEYKRDDGIELTGTLYLPTNYEPDKKYPMIMWAYPREYKDKNSAGQNTLSSNEFTYPYYGSPVYWIAKGYVVLDDAAFPIVGEGEEEPNDTFIKQLVANAKAAIDAVDNMGYIDRNKVAIGGHSYGAFMTANLLSHSDLFAAGIARSGAYNRTLTPFGFQSEERNYWEAPEIYYNMSPFMHADKMKTPLLLIHGEADNNSGTYPLQSERYFNALKGLGARVRLVMLPKESHGYRAKESIMHILWEQDRWLDMHLKNDENPKTFKQELQN